MSGLYLNLRRSFFVYLHKSTVYIYIIISLIVCFLDFRKNYLTEFIKKSVHEIIFSTHSFFDYGIINFKNITLNVTDYFFLKEQNQKLLNEKQVLEEYFIKFKAIEEENKALKKLLNLTPDLTVNYIATKVFGDSNNAFSNSIIIRGGQKTGVFKGQVAINENGLVGRVIEAYDYVSRLMLINDLNSHVPVISSESKERAIINGTSNQKLLKLNYLPDDTQIKDGELITTSGDGLVFPDGILVGKVTKQKNGDYLVAPSVDFQKLNYILLINRISGIKEE